jgi:hypothetical protein
VRLTLWSLITIACFVIGRVLTPSEHMISPNLDLQIMLLEMWSNLESQFETVTHKSPEKGEIY